MKCGIYSIVNKENDKIYIGLTNNINRRWKEHINELNQGKHHSHHLQHAWNKYGESAFEFNVLEYCDEDELGEKEEWWIDYFDSTNKTKGYNERSGGKTNRGSDNPMYRKHHSLESRIKMSNSRKGKGNHKWGTSVIEEWGGLWFLKTMASAGFSSIRISKYTGISKSAILNYTKNRGYSWNELRGDNLIKYAPSKETRKKMSEAMKGREVSDKTKKRISEGLKGREFSDEHKQKISEARKGTKTSEEFKLKQSKIRNTTGYFRVQKKSNSNYTQGFTWVYRYTDKNGKRKGICSVDINELEKKVKAKGLSWYKIK